MAGSECAVILAGGLGTRLKPYTTVLPKPLLPVGDVPILEIVIRQLRGCGFGRQLLAVGYCDRLIRSYFGDGEAFGTEIVYSKEDRPMGTIGPLHLLADWLPDTFLMMNGDLLTDLDYSACLAAHRRSGCALTLATVQREIQVADGVIEIDGKGHVTSFTEKPTLSMPVSSGIYAISRSVLDRVPTDRPFGMDNLVGQMLRDNAPVNVYRHTGEWYDIGCPQDLKRANEAFDERRDTFLAREDEPAESEVVEVG